MPLWSVGDPYPRRVELQPTWFAILAIWLPGATLVLAGLTWGVLRDCASDRPGSPSFARWTRTAVLASAGALLAGLTVLAVIAAVHAHAEQEARNSRVNHG